MSFIQGINLDLYIYDFSMYRKSKARGVTGRDSRLAQKPTMTCPNDLLESLEAYSK